MRSSLRSSLLTAVALCGAVGPAAAQHATATDRTHPLLPTEAAAIDAVVRPIATYRFVGWRGAGLPTEVAVADSAGTIVASFRAPRDRAPRPMSVAVSGGDVVLSGQTIAGPLTLELYEQRAPAPDGALIGRWTLGAQGGDLRGRLVRGQVATSR